MNSVALIGRLTRDVELSYTPQQTAVGKFTLAVDRPKRNGEDAGADFIRITVFGKQAESCNRYLSKGRQAAVTGRINTGSYKNKNGDTVYTTDVIAERVEFIGGGAAGQSGQNRQGYGNQGNNQGYQEPGYGYDTPPDSFDVAEEDIPF